MTEERDHAFTADSAPASYELRLGPYLFEPWADVLLDIVDIEPGARIVDVASGTGVVARAAARRAGPTGRVVATDISAPMIAFSASHPAEEGAAPITTTVASATALGGDDGAYDVLLCQQGLPFFPDRPAAVREMRRVLQYGGVAGVAVWSGRGGLLPFGPVHEVFAELDVPEPFPRAWDLDSFSMGVDEVATMLQDAGFTPAFCEEVELVTQWPDLDHLVDVVKGTPFGGLFGALDPETRGAAVASLRERYATYLQGEEALVPTYATVARAMV